MTTRRTVPEWIGKTPDSDPPQTVKDRILERQGWRCAHFGTRFTALDKPQFDHITPLEAGGENRETNLQALCSAAHAVKTKAEAGERKLVRRKRAKHLGFKARSRTPIPGSRDTPWKRRMDGTVERRG